MTLFEQYGIKEIADVTLYSIHRKEDGSGDVYYLPALYLDTLKVSTIEQSAENTWAQGGLGNSRLINWDFGKTINVTLEDALCTPASLGLCWNGILSADWEDGKVKINSETDNSINRISRMEKAKAPRQDVENGTIAHLLPKIESDMIDDYFGMLKTSAVVDGTDIQGFGTVKGKTYKWKMMIESLVKSIAVVPDRFFDITGKSYIIDQNRKVSVHSLPDYENFKDAIIYKINSSSHFLVPDIPKLIYDAGADIPLEPDVINLTATVSPQEDVENYHPVNTIRELINQDDNYKIYDNDLIAKITIDEHDSVIIETIYVSEESLDETIPELAQSIGYKEINGESEHFLTEIPPTATDVKFFIIDDIDDNTILDDTGLQNGDYVIFRPRLLLNNLNPNFYKVRVIQENDGHLVSTEYETSTIQISIIDFNNFIEEEFEHYEYAMIIKESYTLIDLTYSVYRIVEGSDLDKQIRGYGLKTESKILEESLNKYFWNHKVDMISNDTHSTKIFSSEKSYDIKKADYLAIIVDNYNNYIPIVGVVANENGIGYSADQLYDINEPTPTESENQVIWFNPCPMVEVSQFKGIDMWLRFENLNELIYFLITKYEKDILSIKPAIMESTPGWTVNKGITTIDHVDEVAAEGRLWAYINPHTMMPYADDYWFNQGESYYIKSLTIAPKDKTIKGKKITVKADQWPGMYMMEGETWIRNKDTGNDMRMQIKIPFCKVRSDHTLTLQADGDPTVFGLTLEVAEPRNGEIMEITAYEIKNRLKQDENGRFYAVDGSSEVIIE